VIKNIRKKSARSPQAFGGKRKPSKIEDQAVLVVDDDLSALSAIARLIRSAGFKVRAFSNPEVLLGEALPTSNACLVADIGLPQMNGVELCQRMAASGRALPTIFITGRNDEMISRLVEKSTGIAVLSKPIDEVLLFEAISRCLKSHPLE